MSKALRLLGAAALLASGTTLAMAAQEGHSVGQEGTTGTMTGSQQTPAPATGSTMNTPNGQYSTGTASTPTYTYPKSTTGTPGVSAQASGPRYPGVVGPTGSHQPDATNPVRSNPTGGGGNDTGGSSGGNGNSSR